MDNLRIVPFHIEYKSAFEKLNREWIEEYFVMGRSCTEPKPSPEAVQKMMKEWDSDLDDTLVIGDFLYDLQMGRNAGTATIHVDPSSEFEWPEMADIQCSSLKELQSFLV